MKRAFGYVAADESVKSLYDNVKVLEFEQEVLGHKFNITLANATQASSAVADTTEYEAYLSSKGLTAEAISSVVSSLQNPPPMLLGITSDDKLVMARSTDALQAMVETKERPSDGELQTALLGVTAQAAAEGWKDPSGNFIAPAYRDRCLKAIINSLGGTITEENNRQFMGVTRISLCNAEVASWMTDETTGYNVRGLGWGIKELRVTSIQNYLDTSRITFGYSQDDRIPANGNYLANVSTNEANSNNITCSYQMAVSGITNHRTNVLNALTGSDLLLALEGAGFFNEGGDVEAAKTAIVDAGPTSSGLLLEFGTAAVGLITPLLHKDFCVCADLDGITKVQKGVGWEKLIPTTGKMYASIVNSDFAKMVDQEKYPEQYQALINEPGLVRAVYYLNPIEVAQDTVFSCAAYQHYKEGKDAAGEPDEFGATAVTSEGGLTFDDINAQLNRVTTVHMSVNPIVSTIETASHTPGTKEHALRYPEKYVGVINGVQDGGVYTSYTFEIEDGTGTRFSLSQEDFEIVIKPGVVILKSDGDLGGILMSLYGVNNSTMARESMQAGNFDAGTAKAYDMNWSTVFDSYYPDLSELSGDSLVKGLMLTEGVNMMHLKKCFACLLRLTPNDSFFEA